MVPIVGLVGDPTHTRVPILPYIIHFGDETVSMCTADGWMMFIIIFTIYDVTLTSGDDDPRRPLVAMITTLMMLARGYSRGIEYR